MTAPIRYELHYDVPAWTRLEAIFAASAKLRTNVHVREMLSCEPTFPPGYYRVTMAVEERFDDEPRALPADPGYDEFVDHDPEATYWSEEQATA